MFEIADDSEMFVESPIRDVEIVDDSEMFVESPIHEEPDVGLGDFDEEEPEAVVEKVEYFCPEGKVPGWLDEDGQPQGCVSNGLPVEKEEIPEPIEALTETITETYSETVEVATEEPVMLAETGVDTFWLVAVGTVLVAAGIKLLWKQGLPQ